MDILIGAALALVVGISTSLVGMDRDRALYPTAMIVVAFLYTLFGAMGASYQTIGIEIAVGSVFAAAACLGYRYSLWLVAAALAAHGLMDMVHHRFIDNPGVPAFWPGFCAAYDIVAAVYLAVLISRNRIRSNT